MGERESLKLGRGSNALIAKQWWRLAHFRVAADDINYRRFFNVNDLAGIRMEIPELFDHAHSLVFKLLEDGAIDGLRLDHIDGLLDPKAYCLRIREKAPVPFYLLVEKNLSPLMNACAKAGRSMERLGMNSQTFLQVSSFTRQASNT